MLLKSLVIIGSYFLCYYMAFFWSTSLLLSLGFAIGMGFFAGEVGVSIQHDGNHGKLSLLSWFIWSYVLISFSIPCILLSLISAQNELYFGMYVLILRFFSSCAH